MRPIRRAPESFRTARPSRGQVPGLYYNRSFLSRADREQILSWLDTLHPIWEQRYSRHFPPPPGETQRWLLRPVYWLGNWQFACLDYYRPPQGVHHRCVRAEPFPPILVKLVGKAEAIARRIFIGHDMPRKWHLNTCLINYYGSRIENGKRIDTARVGEHKDFEPGPVASISLGERAMFQFVASKKPGARGQSAQAVQVVKEQWLDDGSLQIFGGKRWKSELFHRVQRVDKKEGHSFPIHAENFEARRINFTFRYVPDEHVVPYSCLPKEAREDTEPYLRELAKHSEFFARELRKARP